MFGGEIEGDVLLEDMFRLGAGASYVYGKNLKNTNGLKDGDPLPLVSPLEFKINAGIEQPKWFVRSDFFISAAQHRYKENYGNAVSPDFGYSDNFWTVDLSSGYKFKYFELIAAAENLNDKLYSYHVSKNSSQGINGYEIPTGRIFEPGRSFWLKIKANF